MEITRNAFKGFEFVRESGVTNMFAMSLVCDLAGITKEEYYEIIKNYDELKEKFSEPEPEPKKVKKTDKPIDLKECEAKMKMWFEGTRKLNIKCCGDDKLKAYYKICMEKGYALEANRLYYELVDRGFMYDDEEMHFETVARPLNVDEIVTFIKEHSNRIGDRGEDMAYKKEGDCIYVGVDYEDMYTIIDIKNNTIELQLGDCKYNLDDTVNVLNGIIEYTFLE